MVTVQQIVVGQQYLKQDLEFDRYNFRTTYLANALIPILNFEPNFEPKSINSSDTKSGETEKPRREKVSLSIETFQTVVHSGQTCIRLHGESLREAVFRMMMMRSKRRGKLKMTERWRMKIEEEFPK